MSELSENVCDYDRDHWQVRGHVTSVCVCVCVCVCDNEDIDEVTQ